MARLYKRLDIPFYSGQHEEVDERVLPDGQLHSVKELVMDRKGRMIHRNSYVNIGSTSSTTTPAGTIWALNEFNNDRIVVFGDPPEMTLYRPATNRNERSYNPIALPAFNAPQVQTLPHELGDTDQSDVRKIDVAINNGIMIVAVQQGFTSTGLTLWYIDDATQQVVGFETVSGTSPESPKLISVGDYVVLCYKDVSNLQVRYVNTSGSTVPFMSNAVTIGSASDISSRGGQFDIVPVTGLTTHFVVVYPIELTTSSDIRVQYHNMTDITGGTGTPEDSEDLTIGAGGGDPIYVAIECTDGVNCCVAWWVDTQNLSYSVGPGDISSAFTNSTSVLIGSHTSGNGYLSIARKSSTSWWVAEGQWDNTEKISVLEMFLADTSFNPNGLDAFANVIPISKLFTITETNGSTKRPYVIVMGDTATKSSGADPFTASYYIMAVHHASLEDDVKVLRTQGIMGKDVAKLVDTPQTLLWGANNVVQDGSGGFAWAGPQIQHGVVAREDGFTDGNNLRIGSGVWRWNSQTRDKLQLTSLGRAGYMSGSIQTRWNGAAITEAGFLSRPDIISVAGDSSGGSMTSNGEYTYIACYVSILNDGEITYSEPSLPVTLTLGASDTETDVEIRDYAFRAFPGTSQVDAVRVYLFRTLANTPGVYYLVAELDAPIIGNAISWGAHIDYNDQASDVSISTNPVIYTDGTAGFPLPNSPPPPCRYLVRVGKRLVAGGTERPEEVWLSKEHVTDEQVAWADDPAFKIVLPAPCTAVGELDGYPILFTRDNIFIVFGRGPDDTGNGEFELRQLPSEHGAITHFVATCDEGLCFQSTRGIELLPRGFGPVQWIGAPVADTLGSDTITSAVKVGHDKTVRFTCPSGVLVWNTTFNFWSVFELGDMKTGGSWGGYHITAEDSWADATPYRETSSIEQFVAAVNPVYETGDIKLDQISGFWRARTFAPVFRWHGISGVTVTVEMSRDGGQTWPAADSDSWELQSLAIDPDHGFSDGDLVTLDFGIRAQKGDILRFRVTISEFLYGEGEPQISEGNLDCLGATLLYKERSGIRRQKVQLRK